MEKLLKELSEEAPERKIFCAKELSKKYQKYVYGTADEILKELSSSAIKGEWVVVIEAGRARQSSLSENDVLELDIPKKSAAKLISKITGENTKSCYQRLLDTNNS